VGDISGEENEISWIEQFELGEVVNAFPKLKFFKARGGNGLGLANMNSPTLETLIVETGGLDAGVVHQIAKAKLPALRHLELWLGSSEYGATVSVEDLAAFLNNAADHASGPLFPNLKYLGVVNSEIADDFAQALHGAKILETIEELDLSRGLLSDKGLEALLNNPKIADLKRIDISNNYISDEDLIERLIAMGPIVISRGQKPAGEDYWYVEVSE
jgi:hypothetical protein